MKNQNILKVCLMVMTLLVGTAIAAAHTLKVKARPDIACTFNKDSVQLEYGNTVSLSAYTQTGFKFLRWEDEAGNMVSAESYFQYTMPGRDVILYAVCEYNPENPGNPNTNNFDAATGTAVLDDFKPGSLRSALSSLLSRINASSSDVLSIIVAGEMNMSDQGILNYYTNCAVLDLSRTWGYEEITSYAFDNSTALQSVILPAGITKIGYEAFYRCSSLREVTCFAMTPPVVGSYAFYGIAEDAVLYVPSAVIPLYAEADGWKDFATILPIQDNCGSIKVVIPAENTGSSSTLSIELLNLDSGQKHRYLVTDRSSYTFYNLPKETRYSVCVKTANGLVIGRKDEIKIDTDEISVIFDKLTHLSNVNIALLTPENHDVTDRVIIEWLDENDQPIAIGANLKDIPAGTTVKYNVKLGNNLGVIYQRPQNSSVTVPEKESTITLHLEPFEMCLVKGFVKDNHGLSTAKATIVVNQFLNGEYSTGKTTETVAHGEFAIEVPKEDATITISAPGYLSQEIQRPLTEDVIDLGTTRLAPIDGTTLQLDIKYQTSALPGVDVEPGYYDNYKNIQFKVYNETRHEDIADVQMQYQQLVVLHKIEEGDNVTVTAISTDDSFSTISSTVTVEGENVLIPLTITERGQIAASYANSHSNKVTGILYDGEGQKVSDADYARNEVTFSNLKRGVYTLVSIEKNSYFSNVLNLSDLSAMGLIEGQDFVSNQFAVADGIISAVQIEDIPAFNETQFYYTNSETRFNSNKTDLVMGNYLTLRADIGFKPEWINQVSDVELIIDMPQNTHFVENSVMLNNKLCPYTLQDNQLIVSLNKEGGQVRFCVIPTFSGNYNPSASLRFALDGKEKHQPIGGAYCEVKSLDLKVPNTVAKSEIIVSGSAQGKSEISIYDDNTLIGTAIALGNGNWSANCQLANPVNLSDHSIHARIVTPTGAVLDTESKTCHYDFNAIEIENVKMYHHNPEMGKMYEIVFDFQNPLTEAQNYIYYIYNKEFTFTLDFTNNKKVTNVVLFVHTSDGKMTALYPTYDEQKDLWVTKGEFGDYYKDELPVSVSVNYDADTEIVLSRSALDECFYDYSDYNEEIQEAADNMDSIFEQMNAIEDVSSEDYSRLMAELNALLGNEISEDEIINLEGMTEDEAGLLIDQFIAQFDSTEIVDSFVASISIFGQYPFEDGSGYLQVEKLESVDVASLLEQGYQQISVSDGNVMLLLETEEMSSYIDVASMVSFKIVSNTGFGAKARMKAAGQGVEILLDYMHQVEEFYERISKPLKLVSNGINLLLKDINIEIASLQKKISDADRCMNYIYSNNDLNHHSNWAQRYAKIEAERELLQKQLKNLQRFAKGLEKVAGTVFKVLEIVSTILEFVDEIRAYYDLYFQVPPCPCIPEWPEAVKTQIISCGVACAGYCLAKCGIILGEAEMMEKSVIAAPATGGSSIVASVSTIAATIIAELITDYIYKKTQEQLKADIRREIIAIRNCEKCYDPECCKQHPELCEPEPEPEPGPGAHPYPGPKPRYGIDPSGYVYEAVNSNRVAGATASIYYKDRVEDMYGDITEQIVRWDASEFDQKNPLTTDELGMYRWDVPTGLWQVKIEKEGYETTLSEWLPVPPPQLDINLPLVQYRQPEVQKVSAYTQSIEIDFDKYMDLNYVTENEIFVTQNDQKLSGHVEYLDAESVIVENDTLTYASSLRYILHNPLSLNSDVQLTISHDVRSYAGVNMAGDFTQEFHVEPEVTSMRLDSIIYIAYDSIAVIPLTFDPAVAAGGHSVAVLSDMPLIASVGTDTLTVNNMGQAYCYVKGELPGTTQISFDLVGTRLKASTLVHVLMDVSTGIEQIITDDWSSDKGYLLVLDINGKMINCIDSAESLSDFDMTTLNDGIYILTFVGENHTTSKKVMMKSH